MTRHRHPATLRSTVLRPRPSPASIAAATAVYDPALLLQQQAVERRQASEALRRHGDGSVLHLRSSRAAGVPPRTAQ
jgi:hypothetical protein